MDPLEEVEPMEGEDADEPTDGASKDAWDLDDDEDEILVLLLEEMVDIVFGGGEAGQPGAHGGSAPGRRANLPRDFDAALKRLQNHYFGVNGSPPLYTEEMFERRYGMPRAVFDRIFERMKGRPEFVQKTDAVGRKGLHPLQRVTGAMRILRYGVTYDAVDEIVAAAESTMGLTVKNFCRSIVEEFGEEYLREPTEEDMKRILLVNESRGFPGCLGSIDCQHWEWKNCPVAWAGQFKGKEKKPTIAMEAIADGELWIWHLSVGHPGSLNDLNIMNHSRTIQRILSGEFPPRLPYNINGTARDLLYWLVDGIYPAWAIFVKSVKGATDDKVAHFSKRQEAVRKDVERAFGVLVARFHILRAACRMWKKSDAMDVLRACVVLHNMCVEARRDDYDTPLYGQALADNLLGQLQFQDAQSFQFVWESKNTLGAGAPVGTWAAMSAERRAHSLDDFDHYTLKGDLIQHLWARRAMQIDD